jgi:hypothetical protein
MEVIVAKLYEYTKIIGVYIFKGNVLWYKNCTARQGKVDTCYLLGELCVLSFLPCSSAAAPL